MANTHLASITEMNSSELRNLCISLGEPVYRAEQILSWIYKKGVTVFSQMTNISTSFREQLAENFNVFQTKVDTISKSPGGTEKFLIHLADNNIIECVLLRDGKRTTVCVSSQVGCAIGCRFCASGLLGLERSLNTGEIIEQILHIKNYLPSNEHITNIVFMGIGEPLANYDNVVKALRIINADWGLGIGARNITVSTVGIVNGIKKLSQEGLKVNLAVSLHASSDLVRNKLIPINENTGINNIIAATKEYFNATHRDISFEYTMINSINDSKQDAILLTRLLADIQCNINILPLNPVKEYNLSPPSERTVEMFRKVLEQNGFVVTIRQRKGNEVDAACGQLRLHKHNISLKKPFL